MKPCKICGEVKELTEFHRAAGMKDGHRNECKVCFRELAKQRYDSKDAVARVTAWRKANAERFAAYQAEYRNRPERKRAMRNLYYRRTHGISADDFDAMLGAQGGVCAICRAPEPTHLDHDHATGAIRGVLCVNCNHGLGKFADDPVLLARAVGYLRGR